MQLAAAGKLVPRVPILIGSNADEGSLLFDDLDPRVNDTGLRVALTNLLAADPIFPPTIIDEVLRVYPPSNFTASDYGTSAWWAGIRMFGDLAMSCPARRTARWVSNRTLRGADVAESYLYFYKRKLDLTHVIELAEQRPYGVWHGSELPLVFDSTKLVLSHAEKQLSLQLMSLWANFAANGRPNGGNSSVVQQQETANALPAWPEYDLARDELLVLDSPPQVVAGVKRAQCDFWDAVHGL